MAHKNDIHCQRKVIRKSKRRDHQEVEVAHVICGKTYSVHFIPSEDRAN